MSKQPLYSDAKNQKFRVAIVLEVQNFFSQNKFNTKLPLFQDNLYLPKAAQMLSFIFIIQDFLKNQNLSLEQFFVININFPVLNSSVQSNAGLFYLQQDIRNILFVRYIVNSVPSSQMFKLLTKVNACLKNFFFCLRLYC